MKYWLTLILATLLSLVIVANHEVQVIRSDLYIINKELSNLKNELQNIEPVIESINCEKYTITAKVTAYAPLDNKSGICADENPTVTSTGRYPVKGVVAVDPKKIPYGTLMFIEGYGFALAADTGGALRAYDGVQIDLVMDDYKAAMDWGVKEMEVIIYDI